MKTSRADRILLGVAIALALAAVALMASLPEDLLDVRPVYQGF